MSRRRLPCGFQRSIAWPVTIQNRCRDGRACLEISREGFCDVVSQLALCLDVRPICAPQCVERHVQQAHHLPQPTLRRQGTLPHPGEKSPASCGSQDDDATSQTSLSQQPCASQKSHSLLAEITVCRAHLCTGYLHRMSGRGRLRWCLCDSRLCTSSQDRGPRPTKAPGSRTCTAACLAQRGGLRCEPESQRLLQTGGGESSWTDREPRSCALWHCRSRTL